ncbi:hypothetical protein THICB1_110001 [Thiomonas arsenitoxydans]|uniref:Transposase n=1 Tax=Thiomonas arsenitoxydans (strain DSM 22701 / CIP 110005 / 3As) TaxID=426114 RepID=A0ABP1YYS2_THIA3|nr:hypothetical protein THICB1_110001 [Thiomonas arsenitoxydans]CQR41108.1 hypothetical protein ACO3_70074 [Thiomonas arsenitoxydans]CQR41205.1 hypothetical protein ACO7_70074 [Thiomonas arsenitoxydans]
MAEGAPLLREYVPKAHQGFESLRLRQNTNKNNNLAVHSHNLSHKSARASSSFGRHSCEIGSQLGLQSPQWRSGRRAACGTVRRCSQHSPAAEEARGGVV